MGMGIGLRRASWGSYDGKEFGRVVFAFFEVIFRRLLLLLKRRFGWSVRGERLENSSKVWGLVRLRKSHSCRSRVMFRVYY